jgi:hypothetical protein
MSLMIERTIEDIAEALGPHQCARRLLLQCPRSRRAGRKMGPSEGGPEDSRFAKPLALASPLVSSHALWLSSPSPSWQIPA